MSNGALWATKTVPRANSKNDGSTARISGAVTTMELLMPVSRCTNGDMAWPAGLTSVWNSPSILPPRTRTAPISVTLPPARSAPVVSKSSTVNVTSLRSVPMSAMLSWPERAGSGRSKPGNSFIPESSHLALTRRFTPARRRHSGRCGTGGGTVSMQPHLLRHTR